ncbi:MAG: RNA polymerase sigma factor SigZ [Rhodothermaceae bacterium]|nr:RNA polymerase sigma factor SigZ [Rhodothermaceae bacterium]
MDKNIEIWKDYRERLLKFVIGRIGKPEDAEDIVHDVMVRAYERRDTLRDQNKLSAWLYQITRNMMVDYYRRQKLVAEAPAELSSPSSAEDPEAWDELADCITPFIENLPPHYREAIILSDIEGLTQRETAERLNLSHSGAKSRIQRARALLAEKFLDCCHVEKDSRGRISEIEQKNKCKNC